MPAKIKKEYLESLVEAGHLTAEGMAALLQEQSGSAPKPKYYRVKLTIEQLNALVEEHSELTFESLYEARTAKKK